MFPAWSLFPNLSEKTGLACAVRGRAKAVDLKRKVKLKPLAYDIHYDPVKQSMRQISEEIPFRMKSRFFPRRASDAGKLAFKGNRSIGFERGRNRPEMYF
ncbi:hypothetical protein TNCT_712421 [Trichonephila clavata]|uniref:Uncharacterized protein n=1 Tax=Trichonephila clavata TaxID=2740835 RepID=A0A8X6LJE9_TRICU|nr:hypothetical protein TNCT_712421 [Trichonephila clavata]